MKPNGKKMDASVGILCFLVLGAGLFAFHRDPALAKQGLLSTFGLFKSVGFEIALGFLLTGFMSVLIPASTLMKLFATESNHRGIWIAWAVGLLIPGGPYVFFPLAAGLFAKGMAPEALITLIAAKTLVSPLRAITYEAPLLGWPMTLARLIPGILVAPLLGFTGAFLFRLFGGKGVP
jgi:uncharacterized protein